MKEREQIIKLLEKLRIYCSRYFSKKATISQVVEKIFDEKGNCGWKLEIKGWCYQDRPKPVYCNHENKIYK